MHAPARASPGSPSAHRFFTAPQVESDHAATLSLDAHDECMDAPPIYGCTARITPFELDRKGKKHE